MSLPKASVVLVTFLILWFGSADFARADQVTVGTSNTGWYRGDGFHDGGNSNYIAGHCVSCGGDFRNYFTFDLSSVVGPATTITGATIQLARASTAGSPGTYTLFDVATPIGILTASNSGPVGLAIFNDLGSGTAYGTVNVSTDAGDLLITINLNAAAIAALNASHGGVFAVGGFFSAPSAPADSFVFGGTGTPEPRNQLILSVNQPLPEPMTIFLLGTGLAGLVGTVRRQRK